MTTSRKIKENIYFKHKSRFLSCPKIHFYVHLKSNVKSTIIKKNLNDLFSTCFSVYFTLNCSSSSSRYSSISLQKSVSKFRLCFNSLHFLSNVIRHRFLSKKLLRPVLVFANSNVQFFIVNICH